jgi:hypothetical protein
LLLDERIDVVVGEIEGVDVGAMLHALASFVPAPAFVARVGERRDDAESVLRLARVERVDIVEASADPERIAEIVRKFGRRAHPQG